MSDKKFQRLNKKISSARSAYDHGGLHGDDQRGVRKEYTRGQRQLGKLQAEIGLQDYQELMSQHEPEIDYDEYRD